MAPRHDYAGAMQLRADEFRRLRLLGECGQLALAAAVCTRRDASSTRCS
jgi:hypothetical protein